MKGIFLSTCSGQKWWTVIPSWALQLLKWSFVRRVGTWWRVKKLIIVIHGTSGSGPGPTCGIKQTQWESSVRIGAVSFVNVCKCFYYFSGFCFCSNRVAIFVLKWRTFLRFESCLFTQLYWDSWVETKCAALHTKTQIGRSEGNEYSPQIAEDKSEAPCFPFCLGKTMRHKPGGASSCFSFACRRRPRRRIHIQNPRIIMESLIRNRCKEIRDVLWWETLGFFCFHMTIGEHANFLHEGCWGFLF